MSEPLGVEKRALWKSDAERYAGESYSAWPNRVLALLDEIDRLTEALETAEREHVDGGHCLPGYRAGWDAAKSHFTEGNQPHTDAMLDALARAERAEAELADALEGEAGWKARCVGLGRVEKRLRADLAQSESTLAGLRRVHAETLKRFADEKRRRAAEIAAAEQRGREDNADHGQCYVHGSKALAALLAEARAEGAAGLRAGVEGLAGDLSRSRNPREAIVLALQDLLDTAAEETGTL